MGMPVGRTEKRMSDEGAHPEGAHARDAATNTT